RGRRPSWSKSEPSATRREGRGTSRAPTPCGPRSRRPAGRCGTARTDRCSIRAMAAELIYGTPAVREALRGQRQVLRVGCTWQAGEQSEWLPDDAVIETSERLGRLAESGDHQGVVAEGEPERYADAGG